MSTESHGGDEGQAPVNELSYAQASQELDKIVEFFERRDVDVDQLVSRLERATAIVDELDKRIRKTRAQVEKLVPRLEGVRRDPASEEDDADDWELDAVAEDDADEVLDAWDEEDEGDEDVATAGSDGQRKSDDEQPLF